MFYSLSKLKSCLSETKLCARSWMGVTCGAQLCCRMEIWRAEGRVHSQIYRPEGARSLFCTLDTFSRLRRAYESQNVGFLDFEASLSEIFPSL